MLKEGIWVRKTVHTLINSFNKGKRIALACDLHAGNPKKAIAELKKIKPDYILLAGDILEALDGRKDLLNERAFPLLEECAKLAPTFYCTGNHEDAAVHSQTRKWKECVERKRVYTEENIERINNSGVKFLIDDYAIVDGLAIGGLSSGILRADHTPDIEFLNRFSALEVPKILICHHPEYYEKYIKELPIELTVSGHAHGGQWRIFGQGIYSPGQGLFPKYTSGLYDGRLVVSRGLKRPWPIPRFFNPREIVIIEI